LAIELTNRKGSTGLDRDVERFKPSLVSTVDGSLLPVRQQILYDNLSLLRGLVRIVN
jgi:hypothetical protein